MRRPKLLLAGAIALSLLAAACGSDSDASSPQATTAPATPTTAAGSATTKPPVATDGVKLRVSLQDPGWTALIDESGVLEGTDYDVEWVLLTGPAANLQALYAGEIDLGHMGDTSLTIEQANDKDPWTADTAPLKIVAGWRNNFDPAYAPLITAVRTNAGIDSLADLAGQPWSFNFGGYNHAQYLGTLALAKLTEKDIKPAQLADQATSAAAFVAGDTKVYSGGQGPVYEAIQKGDAKILVTAQDTGIPALNVWTARAETLNDPAKDAALHDFFGRLSGFWDWYAANEAAAKKVLQTELKLTDLRTEFEYQLRKGTFRTFDDALLKQEQAVADSLLAGGGIPKAVNAPIGFDARYNEDQGSLTAAEVAAGA